jgi:hypothetical protein
VNSNNSKRRLVAHQRVSNGETTDSSLRICYVYIFQQNLVALAILAEYEHKQKLSEFEKSCEDGKSAPT